MPIFPGIPWKLKGALPTPCAPRKMELLLLPRPRLMSQDHLAKSSYPPYPAHPFGPGNPLMPAGPAICIVHGPRITVSHPRRHATQNGILVEASISPYPPPTMFMGVPGCDTTIPPDVPGRGGDAWCGCGVPGGRVHTCPWPRHFPVPLAVDSTETVVTKQMKAGVTCRLLPYRPILPILPIIPPHPHPHATHPHPRQIRSLLNQRAHRRRRGMLLCGVMYLLVQRLTIVVANVARAFPVD